MPSVFKTKTQQQQQKLSFSHPQISITSCWMAAVFYSGFDDPLFTRDLAKGIDRQILGASERDYHCLLLYERLQIPDSRAEERS